MHTTRRNCRVESRRRNERTRRQSWPSFCTALCSVWLFCTYALHLHSALTALYKLTFYIHYTLAIVNWVSFQTVDQIRRQSSWASCEFNTQCATSQNSDATQLAICVASAVCIGHYLCRLMSVRYLRGTALDNTSPVTTHPLTSDLCDSECVDTEDRNFRKHNVFTHERKLNIFLIYIV